MGAHDWRRWLNRRVSALQIGSGAVRGRPFARGTRNCPRLQCLEGRSVPAIVTVTGSGDAVAEDGLVTLREAITSANNNADVNEDVAAAGDYGLDTINFSIPRPSTDGLVSWWRGEGDPNDLIDGNSAVGRIGSPQFVAARYGQGMQFAGSDGFSVPDTSNPNLDFDATASFTIDAWVRVDGVPTNTSVLVEKRQQAGPTGYSLYLQGTSAGALAGRLGFIIQTDNASAFAAVDTAAAVAVGQFHHLAAVVDRSANTLSLFLDGALQGTASTANVGDITNSGRFFIGHNSEDIVGSTGVPFHGVIDELGVSNRALSAAEVQAIATGVRTIRPAPALPDVTDPVAIDGYTQPGASANTDPNGFNGTLLVEISGADAGSAHGLKITAGNSTVRGLVINGFRGLGSFVGNAFDLDGGGGNHIEGNFIGTDPTGTLARGNEQHAIAIEVGSNDNVIGGTDPAARNVISGSGRVAFFIATASNSIQGNFIGTQRDGTSPLGNQQGVGFVGVGGANNNLVGGMVPGAGNVIAFSDFRGVTGAELAGTGNSVLGNSIHSNGELGIDWLPVGPTLNDQGDGDTGANNLQNFPAITSVTSSGSSTTIQGTLNSTPRTNGFRLEFFANNAADPSGFGEGQTFLGSKVVDTDGSGNATFTLTVPTAVAVGQFVSATATDPAGNTSEFSQALKVTLGSGIVVSDVRVIEGNSGTRVAEFVVSLLGGTARPVTVHVATAQGTAAAGSDYYSAVQTLVFKPGGPTSQIVRVRVAGDRRVERDETFLLNVLYVTGAPVADRQGVGTIVNDDSSSHARQSIDGTSVFDPNALDWLSSSHDRTRKWPW